MQEIHNRAAMKPRRKDLRRALTPAEAVLWRGLQRSQVNGKKFRRQHSVGNYILDFYCPECRLAVELDGQGHFNSTISEYDYRRSEYLKKLKIRVLRFENRFVFEHPEGVLHAIREHLTLADGGIKGIKRTGNEGAKDVKQPVTKAVRGINHPVACGATPPHLRRGVFGAGSSSRFRSGCGAGTPLLG
jgi:very-short-patch-repair endonuclease